MRARRRLTLLLPLLWALVIGAIAWRRAGLAPDDMFISFRYAWNLAHGAGFVFNPGERVFGLTNPGHALVLALLHAATRVPVHILGTSVYALGLWGVVTLLWSEARRRGSGLEAALGGSLVVGASYVWAGAGSSATMVMALLAASALVIDRRPARAGLLGGLAVWYRPEAVLGLAALGGLAWLEGRSVSRRRLAIWALVAAAVVAVGALGAWLWFGSALPNTLAAKRAMAGARIDAWIGPIRFWARATLFLGRHFGSGWLLLTAFGVAGLWPLFARGGRAVRTLVLYGAALAVAYPLLATPYYQWYTVATAVALLYGVAGFGAGLGRELGRGLSREVAGAVAEEAGGPGDAPAATAPSHRFARAAGWAVAALVLLPPALPFARASGEWLARVDAGGRYDTYREAGLWIREHSLPEERILFGEIGTLAYWSRRPVDDLQGLVTPEMLPYVAAGDPLGAFLRRPPDLFPQHPGAGHPQLVAIDWFSRAYYPVVRIPDAEGGAGVVVYRRRPGVAVPPARPPFRPPPPTRRRREPRPAPAPGPR